MMSLLSAPELIELVKAGVIEGVSGDAINAASIDLHLGNMFLRTFLRNEGSLQRRSWC